MKILVDTNVIIDILCKREPFFEDSYNALNKCIDNHTIIVSASAITDIFYIARKYIGSEQAKECIRNLLDLIKISDTRGADIEKALSSDISDFEDAVVSAIAERQKAKYILGLTNKSPMCLLSHILTRNTKDFEKSKILSITPHDYLNINK